MNELNGVLHGKERTARHPRRSAALAAALITVALTGIAACSSSSSAPPPSSASDTTPSVNPGVAHAQQQVAEYEKAVTSFPAPGPALDAQRVAALKGKTILFVPDGLIGPFPAIQQGVQTALGHLGVTVKTCDPNFLPTQVAACFGEAKTDGAVAVITAGIPYSLAANAYQALEQEHIPVMVSTAGPGNPANTSDIAFEPGDVSAALAGTVSADQVIADSGGKASVLFVAASGSPTVASQAKATEAEFAKYCPGCTVTTVSFDPTATSQIASSVSSALISNPSTNYILSQADAYVPYIVTGMQSAGSSVRAEIVSETAVPAVLDMVQQKQGVSADIAFDSSYIGWNAVDGMLRLLTGITVPAEPYDPVRVFNAANLTGLHLSAGMATDPLYGSTSFEQMFYALWEGEKP
jgi:ribose transport system substrate-binding protein